MTKKDKLNQESIIAIWNKTIDVQMHFNDIQLRIRNYALTLLTFIMGGVGFLLKENISIPINDAEVSVAFFLGIIGYLILLSFYFMDKVWYHRLLLGAVKNGLEIEKEYFPEDKFSKLTTTIKNESPITFFGKEIHTNQKLNVFYSIISLVLLCFSIFLISSQFVWCIYLTVALILFIPLFALMRAK